MNRQYKRRFNKRNLNNFNNDNNYEQDGNNYYKPKNFNQRYYKKKNNKNNKNKRRNLKNQHVLNTHWNVYVHDVTDRDWSLSSYKNIFKIETIEDFWVLFGHIQNYQKFQFFIMRGDIKPTYEDPENKNGGSYSYMIQGREVNETFVHVLAKMIGEQLVSPELFNEIKGISLVPKKGISILKIWLKNKNNPLELDINDIPGLRNGRFQPHKF